MKEIKKDLFECIFDPDVDAICITTNGNYTMNGLACMGGGCARECADRWPQTAKNLGTKLKATNSNIPFIIGAVDEDGNYLEPTKEMIKNKQYKCLIFSFPTINNIMDGANLQLIKQSAAFLNDYVNSLGLKNIVSARFGSGIGGLVWANVKTEVADILDNRYTIVSFDHEE